MNAKNFIVYRIDTTVQERAFVSKGAAQRFADKLNAKVPARETREYEIMHARESLNWQRDIVMSNGQVNPYIAQYTAKIAKLEAEFAVWGNAKYAVAERMEYRNEVVYWKAVRSVMNGAVVYERSSLPYYLSVGSETYWSR
jgi:hypothetical protein